MERHDAILRIYLFGHCLLERRLSDGTWEEVPLAAWKGYTYPRSLLKYLARCPERKATRSAIFRHLGPEAGDPEGMLNSAALLIRKACGRQVLQTFGRSRDGGYQLADQSLVWVDADACLALVKQAEQHEEATLPERRTILEQALALFQRGPLLQDEEGVWCYAERGFFEKKSYQCRLWLAEVYEQQGQFDQAEALYSGLLVENLADETALRRLLTLLQRQGMAHLARNRYQEFKRFLKAQEGESYSADMEAFAERISKAGWVSALPVASSPSMVYTTFIQPSPLEIATLDTIRSRRQILQSILYAAYASLPLSSSLLIEESLNRLESALKRPSQVGPAEIEALSSITVNYWNLCKNSSLEIFSGIAGHFSVITQLLKESHPTPIHRELCSLLAQGAQLLGTTLNDLREYELAWSYYLLSIKAAQEAGNPVLKMVSLGRMALLLIYWDDQKRALLLTQEAQTIMSQSTRTSAWLRAIEAEIFAHFSDYHSYTRAIDASKSILAKGTLEPDLYATGFGPSRLSGYEGASLVRLRQPEQALPILQQAARTTDSNAYRRLSRIYIDLGATYAQLGEIKNACDYAHCALEIAEEIKSLNALHRLRKVQVELEPWKEHAEVKNLHEHIRKTASVLSQAKEAL